MRLSLTYQLIHVLADLAVGILLRALALRLLQEPLAFVCREAKQGEAGGEPVR